MPRIIDFIARRLSGYLTPLLLLVQIAALALSGCGGDGGTASTRITAQPASISVVAGGEADLSVSATGADLAYQWQRSADDGATWTDIPAATAPTCVVAGVDATLAGVEFHVVVTGSAGSVTSSAVTVTVTPAPTSPTITTQPGDQSATVGAGASFSVTANGTSLAYQWQTSADGTTWVDIAGATQATLTLAAVTLSQDGEQVRVVVSNSIDSIPSGTAVLRVHAATAQPTIETPPSPASVVAPQTATFSVVASGDPAPTYQWQKSIGGAPFADIALATAATYVTPATSLADDGTLFRVLVTNSVASVPSASVALKVSAAAAGPVFSVQPVDVSVTAPQAATFSATVTGSPSPTLQWQSSPDGTTFANINGATSASYTTPTTTSADSGKWFRVVATNTGGSVSSNHVQLTVNGPPGGQGSGGLAQCAIWAMPAGTTVKTTFADPGSPQLAGTQTVRNNGLVLFAGHQATEVEIDGTIGGAILDFKVYGSFDATSGVATDYGSVSHTATSDGSAAADSTSILTPAVEDDEFTLAAGQSVAAQTEISSVTTTLTVNGVAGTPSTSTPSSTAPGTTFVGMESVTVTAGTFNTCRYLSTDGTTQWLLPTYGVPVKNSMGQYATLILVNGVALTHN